MQNEHLISIVVPVYNAERYLPACVDSVLSQTYGNWELILVDDGSTDGSLAVCRKYAAKDPRVQVIHQENQGVSAARNTGLEYVAGTYITFLDSDDYIDRDYLSVLLTSAVSHGADMVCCDFYDVVNGQKKKVNTPRVLHKRLVVRWEELFSDAAVGKEDYSCCVWGKLIKTELAKKCKFQPLRYGEDQVFMYDLFLQKPLVYLTDYPGYYYVLNESGAMQSANQYNIIKCLNDVRMRRYKLEKLPSSMNAVRTQYVAQYASSVVNLGKASLMTENWDEKKQAREAFLQEVRTVIENRSMLPPRLRAHLLLCRFIPGLYRRIFVARELARMRANK